MTTHNPIDLACRVLHVKQSELARRLGVSNGLVSQWKQRGQISTKHVMKVVEMTGLPANLFNSFFPPSTEVAPRSAKPKAPDQTAV